MILGDKWYLTMSISIIWHVLIKSFYHCFFCHFHSQGSETLRIRCEALRKLQRIADVYELVVETGMLNLKTAGIPWFSWWISWGFNGNLDWNHHEITTKSPWNHQALWVTLNPFWQGGKADEGETSFSEVSCCCVIWILQKVHAYQRLWSLWL